MDFKLYFTWTDGKDVLMVYMMHFCYSTLFQTFESDSVLVHFFLLHE